MHSEELGFIQEAFDRNWIAPLGFNCDNFEKEIADYLGSGNVEKYHTLALVSGTSALHLAVKLAGVKAGDVVLCSDMTFSATVNPVSYEGAQQVFIDAERDTWNMDPIALEKAFEKYKPDIVYHAAAHKHVPLMEDSPCESIKNNAIGTYKTAYAAMMNGCKRFVLISTDKAVNPTNIMGASKRICEMIIQSFDRKIRDGKTKDLYPIHTHTHTEDVCEDMVGINSDYEKQQTEFVAVRFGNVLGSNGSVVPRFKEQIAKGGPVTVTHPDIIRYFMTIPEAVSLVLQAGTYADGGEIFVLDMGSPVKIETLARNLIRLSGLKPDVDIKIEYTGLRAGEKLYEEKLMSEEGLRTTPNHLIHIGKPVPFDTDVFLNQLQELMRAAYDGREDTIRNLVAKAVPTYHPAGEHGSEAKGEANL